MQKICTDVLIVGSGAAGMCAAIEASIHSKVLLISKGFSGFDGSTVTAQADIAVDSAFCQKELGLPGDNLDSLDCFAADMLREGDFIADESLVQCHVEGARRAVLKLKKAGLHFRGLVHNPGHTYPRGLWVSGVELARLLRKELDVRSNIQIMDNTILIDIIVNNDGVAVGAVGYDLLSGTGIYFSAKAIVICCGGAMGLYPFITAPDGLSGDGIAAAFRAGAAVVDMEFPMFLPYSILKPDILCGITFTHDLTMMLDVHALNREGQRYMTKWDSIRMEHTTRDINAVAAGYEIFKERASEHGGVYISMTHIPQNIIDYTSKWFPSTISHWRCGGFDLKKYLPDVSKNAIETIPACHFWNGGIKIDICGRTSVPGLFAGGEGTGSIHGANRISGNGITQALVWGTIAGRNASDWAQNNQDIDLSLSESVTRDLVHEHIAFLRIKNGVNPVDLRTQIQQAAWKAIGLVRNANHLSQYGQTLKDIKGKISEQALRTNAQTANLDWNIVAQNRNLYDIAQMVCIAATMRTESRGAHFRLDYPETDDINWLKNIVIHKKGDEVIAQIVNVSNYMGRSCHLSKRPYGKKGGIRLGEE